MRRDGWSPRWNARPSATWPARAQVRYAEIPIVFTETRSLAEEWSFRWLGAALTESMATRETWGDEDSD
jgi:hypothetical protein